MWVIRILSGPHAGQVFHLKAGRNKIGRASHCDIQIPAIGISKEHAEINVLSDKILIADLKSSNGTFVNGVRIQGGVVKSGDKLGFHDVILDILPEGQVGQLKESTSLVPTSAQMVRPAPQYLSPHISPSAPMPAQPISQNPTQRIQGMKDKAQDYVDQVVMPGVYRLPEMFEYKYVIMMFVAAYIVLVSIMAVIPMKVITAESIEVESQRRALTIARSLAQSNESSMRGGNKSNFNADLFWREDGIEDVYVIGKDGSIVAPENRVGMMPTREAGFIRKIRGSTLEMAELSSGLVVAGVPILGFDPEVQQNIAKGYAIVVYNTGSLAFNEGRSLSLVIQTLTIALLLGGILFFFLQKLIERPIQLLNKELDSALREGKDHAQIPIRFSIMQGLLTNINSLLSRASHAGEREEMGAPGYGSRNNEMQNLLHLIGYPALLINQDYLIIQGNPAFEALTGISLASLKNQPIEYIPDQAMQKNVAELIRQSKNAIGQIFSDHLEISGHGLKINCQAVSNHKGEVEYFILTISPQEQAHGGAA